ncbi:MAG: hypothetical protein IPK52_12805 [Chloroflexi bacterium]|nr:hypothetical protein [Chloroflexota bacterium]
MARRSPGEFTNFNYNASLGQYLRARLALAYILTGHAELASPVLDTLTAEAPVEPAVGLFIETLDTLRHSGIGAGNERFVYNLFTEIFPKYASVSSEIWMTRIRT